MNSSPRWTRSQPGASMSMNDLHGRVILYSYLWRREYLRGEESGRKARPTCVMIIVRGKDGARTALLFPITSQPPSDATAAVAIPEIEAKRARLYVPAWVIVEEFNGDDPEKSFALEDATALGRFSRPFMMKIAAAASRCMRERGVRAVPRDR